MTERNREPDAREVEALAVETNRTWWQYSYNPATSCISDRDREVARFILAREARLVAALEDAYEALGMTMASGCLHGDGMPREATKKAREAHYAAQVRCCEALAAHRAATKPPEPTLAERVAQLKEARDRYLKSPSSMTFECISIAIEGVESLAREQAKP